MNWTAKPILHKSEKRIAAYFEKNADLIVRIKQIDGASWSQKTKPLIISEQQVFKIIDCK